MTLIELMISMLILTLVCVAWLEIIGIQSAKKEARRREAVERLAGMMDAFMYWCKSRYNSDGLDASYNSIVMGNYRFDENEFLSRRVAFSPSSNDKNSVEYVRPVFDPAVSPIGYRLCVVAKSNLPNQFLFGDQWGSKKIWLLGELYDHHGTSFEAGKSYFQLPVCLGIKGR